MGCSLILGWRKKLLISYISVCMWVHGFIQAFKVGKWLHIRFCCCCFFAYLIVHYSRVISCIFKFKKHTSWNNLMYFIYIIFSVYVDPWKSQRWSKNMCNLFLKKTSLKRHYVLLRFTIEFSINLIRYFISNRIANIILMFLGQGKQK